MSDKDAGGFDELGLDDALRADLRLAGELDEPPAEAMAAAKASFAWRTMDAELAELVEDSPVDENRLAGVRSTVTTRMLTFRSSTLTVELEALGARDRLRLVGQLVPPQVGRIEVRHGGGTVTVVADELGRFSADVSHGPMSLRCSGVGAGNEIITDWIVV